MKLSRRQQFMWALVGLSLIISAVLTYIFREQVRAGLVMPISYAVWYVNLVIESAPQPILWAVLVFGGFVIAGTSAAQELATLTRTGRANFQRPQRVALPILAVVYLFLPIKRLFI